MDIVRRLSQETSPTFAKLWIWGVWVITLKHNFVTIWLKGFSVSYRGADGAAVQVKLVAGCGSCLTC